MEGRGQWMKEGLSYRVLSFKKFVNCWEGSAVKIAMLLWKMKKKGRRIERGMRSQKGGRRRKIKKQNKGIHLLLSMNKGHHSFRHGCNGEWPHSLSSSSPPLLTHRWTLLFALFFSPSVDWTQTKEKAISESIGRKGMLTGLDACPLALEHASQPTNCPSSLFFALCGCLLAWLCPHFCCFPISNPIIQTDRKTEGTTN